MTDRKSATTVSPKLHCYSPGTGFSYNFEARTFSREGKRPATSPARIKHSSLGKRKGKGLSPDGNNAQALNSAPALAQEMYGSSLLMLRQGLNRVRPRKFLELRKLMNQPSPSPLTTPRTDLPTPRLVKTMVARVKTADSDQRLSKDTQNIRLRRAPRSPSSITRSQPTDQFSNEWDSKDRQSSAYTKSDEIQERCVRCAEFPDIQIEGNSLSRILTNKNVLMAKEHCEVLGAVSCPDCVRVKSQRNHENHCSKNTPPVPNDVYKIALVHERSPHLTKKEVQRKFFDGEISDKVLAFSYWKQSESLSSSYQFNDQLKESGQMEQKFLPNINESKPPKSNKIKSSKPLQAAFETIYEASETGTDSETDNSSALPQVLEKENVESKQMTYQKHDAEKMLKIEMVPASENVTEVKENVVKLSDAVQDAQQANNDAGRHTIAMQLHKSVGCNIPTTVTGLKLLNQRCFTLNVVPSKNFFFDISDLARRLRLSGMVQNVSRKPFLERDLHRLLQPKTQQQAVSDTADDNADNESVRSNDSIPPLKDFNMSYEPPVFYNYKGGYLGLNSAATSRTSSSVV